MQIRTRPFLTATALGTGILVLYYLITGAASYIFVGRMLDCPMFDPSFLAEPNAPLPFDPATDDPMEFILGIPGETFSIAAMCLTLAGCFLWVGAGMGTGALYARLHHREEALTDAPIKGGAAAGALAYVAGTLMGSILNLLMIAPFFERFSALFTTLAATDPGMPAGMPGQLLLIWAGSFVVGIVCSTLFWGLLGAAFGAIGSIIGKGFLRTEPPAAGLV